MRIKWFTKKTESPDEEAEWPDEINGYKTRPRYGECPECHAAGNAWCEAQCTRLDPMDYR